MDVALSPTEKLSIGVLLPDLDAHIRLEGDPLELQSAEYGLDTPLWAKRFPADGDGVLVVLYQDVANTKVRLELRMLDKWNTPAVGRREIVGDADNVQVSAPPTCMAWAATVARAMAATMLERMRGTKSSPLSRRLTKPLERLLNDMEELSESAAHFKWTRKREMVKLLGLSEKFVIDRARMYDNLRGYFKAPEEVVQPAVLDERIIESRATAQYSVWARMPYEHFVVELHGTMNQERVVDIYLCRTVELRPTNELTTMALALQSFSLYERSIYYGEEVVAFGIGEGRPQATVLLGKPQAEVIDTMQGDLGELLWVLALPDVVIRRTEGVIRTVGPKEKAPVRSYFSRVSIRPGARHIGMIGPMLGPGKPKRGHWRRGHIRRLRDGRIVTVRPAAINDPPPVADRLYEY